MAAPAPPSYYTFQKQVPLGQGQALGFTPGKGYYARGALAQAAAADPYAALTGYQPLTPAQIQAQAQNEISPIIQAITGQANQQAGTEAAQINALTQDYANELGQINIGAPYQQAEGQQAAVDSALQQSLTGAGSSQAAGLANTLAALQGSSGAGAVGQAANALTSQGASSGNTALANGSAALSNLIANAAAGGEFGAKMPLIADLSGLQALGENAGQQQQDISNAVLQAETQLPSIVQDLAANNETALSNAATAEQATQQQNYEKGLALFEQSGKLTPEAAMLMGLPASDVGATTVTAQKDAADVAQTGQKIAISQQNANTAAAKAAASAQAAMTRNAIAAENAKTAAARAKATAAYQAAEIKLKQAQGVLPKMTPTTLKDAGQLAQDLYHGVTKPKAAGGTEIVAYSQTYQDAIKAMVSQYPELGMKRIMQLVNRWYPAGGKFPDGTPNGRPALNAKQQKQLDRQFPLPFGG